MRWGIGIALLAIALAVPGSAAAYGPLSSFGTHGNGLGQLGSPSGIAVAADGTAYVSDFENQRVSVYKADGTFLRTVGAAELSAPTGLALGPEGDLFVADYFADRVFVYSPDGGFVRAIGESGEGAGSLELPGGLAFDDAGLLYVADGGNHRIDVFTPGGVFVRAFGKEVEFGGTADVCFPSPGCMAGAEDGSAGAISGPNAVASAPGGQVAIADEGNHRIDVFTAAGAFVRAFGREVKVGGGDLCEAGEACQAGEATAAAGAFDFPIAIAADSSGAIYVADRFNNRISVSDIDGTFLRAFGEGVIDGDSSFQICDLGTGCLAGGAGSSAAAIAEPQGLALDCRGSLWVAEKEASRVARFGEPGTPLPPCDEEETSSPSSTAAPSAPSGFTNSPPVLRLAGLRRNLRNGTAVLFVRVREPGRLILRGRGVRRLVRGAQQPRRVRLPIRPKVRLRRYLKRHRKARIRVSVLFRPYSGAAPKTLEKRVVLKRKKHRSRHNARHRHR